VTWIERRLRRFLFARAGTILGVVQKQPFSGNTVEQKRPAQAGGMIVRNSNKSAAL